MPKHMHLYAYASVCYVFNVEHLCVPKQVSLLQSVFNRFITLFVVLALSRANHIYLLMKWMNTLCSPGKV